MATTHIVSTAKDYAVVFTESEHGYAEYGNCLKESFTPDLPRLAHIDLSQNDPSDLLQIWNCWDSSRRKMFSERFGDIALLLTIKIDEQPIRAMMEFWDPTYRCFSINQEDLTPTIEEYTTILRISQTEDYLVYLKEHKPGPVQKKLVKTFRKVFLRIDKYSVRKGNMECIPTKFLIDALNQNLKTEQAIDMFAFAIYGLFVFPRVLTDLLYKDYAQPPQQPLQIRYRSYDWNFNFSCQVEEVLPGLNTVFSVIVPDSGKAELQYLRDYVGFSAGFGLKANTRNGFDPIANISGVIGTTLFSLGADLGIDITTRTLNNFGAGFSLNSALLIASLTMSDGFDSVKASVYHPLYPPTRTSIAAELKHRISDDATTVTLGVQHELIPFTLVKARMDTDGKVSGVLRQELWQRFYVSISGELDLRNNNSIPRIGLSMDVKH